MIMRRISVTILFIIVATSTMLGQIYDAHNEAKRLNQQLKLLLTELPKYTGSAYNLLLQRVITTGIACDSLDGLPNKKGAINPVFRESNRMQLSPLRDQLLERGLSDNDSNRIVNIPLIDLYVRTTESPLFDNNDIDIAEIYYKAAATAYYGTKDYGVAEYYADHALQYESTAEKAAEIKIMCMQHNMKTHNDSTRYVIALLELHDKAPENEKFFQMLLEYFTSHGHKSELIQFANDEISKDSTNSEAWALLGEICMKNCEWAMAEKNLQQAICIDSTMVGAYYNLGICYSSEAIELKDSLVDKRGRLTKENRVRVKGVFEKAQINLEKAREFDPEQLQVKWAVPLYQVYYAIGQRQLASQIKELIK
jgi:tetratricopeptide (TPR) repeat protein